MAGFVRVLSVNELGEGQAKAVVANGVEIALYKANGKFYATQAQCPHKNASLAEGELDGTAIMCPLHARTFDITSGSGISDISYKAQCYAVKVEGSDVLVEV